MDYVESLRWLLALPDFERTGDYSPREDVSLMRALLAELGDPHIGRPTMHIAGSKGKGSTGAMSEAILRGAGARTGFYISPHLHRFNERIRIDTDPASHDAFAGAMTSVREAIERVAARTPERSFVAFDALTAGGFVAFRDAEVEAQIIEVGLGGRLDPTNVFDATDVVVLTPISLEHTAVLGSTIPEIAREKAAIIKPGSTVVIAPQRESALDVFRERAAEAGSPVTEVASVCQMSRSAATAEHQDFKLKTSRATYDVRLPLLGRHQTDNAATAIIACEELMRRMERDLDASTVRRALADVRWPARIEVIKRKPLVVVDGAHNGDSMKRLVVAMREHFGVASATVLFGTLAGKDVEAMADVLAPFARDVLVTSWPSARAAEPRAAAERFRRTGASVTAYGSLPQACDAAEAEAGERGTIVACGSIAFAAAVREYLLGLESDMIMLASEASSDSPDARNKQ